MHVYVIDQENEFIWNIIRFLRISEYVVVKKKEEDHEDGINQLA